MDGIDTVALMGKNNSVSIQSDEDVPIGSREEKEEQKSEHSAEKLKDVEDYENGYFLNKTFRSILITGKLAVNCSAQN